MRSKYNDKDYDTNHDIKIKTNIMMIGECYLTNN